MTEPSIIRSLPLAAGAALTLATLAGCVSSTTTHTGAPPAFRPVETVDTPRIVATSGPSAQRETLPFHARYGSTSPAGASQASGVQGFDPYQAGAPNESGAIHLVGNSRPRGAAVGIDPASIYGQDLLGAIPGAGPIGDASETANITQVTFTEVGSDFDPDVSNDGRFVVFSSTQHNPNADIYLRASGRNVITQITQDGAHDVMPAISPDNRRIAFASNRFGNWDIFVIDREGGKPVQVTQDGAHELHPSWSPDGSRLLFSRLGRSSGRWEMWVVDTDNPSRAHFIGYGLFAEWAPTQGPDGQDRIVFQRSRERGERAFGIWTIDYADGQSHRPTLLASSPTRALINPTWSPDGRFIVYASVPNPTDGVQSAYARPESADLWMVDVDGLTQVSLTKGAAVDLMPTWSPDGQLYFVSNRSGREALWSLDTAPAVLAASGLRGENSSTASAPTDR